MSLPSLLLIAVTFFTTITFTMCEDRIPKVFRKRLNECCSMPQPFPVASLHACDRKARQSHASRTYIINLCKMECYYNELGIISDYTLVWDQVKQYLENIEDPAREFYETAFKSCDDEFNAHDKTFSEALCSSYAILLHKCVEEKKIQKCPEEYFVETDLCNKVKQGHKFCHQ